MPQIINHGQVKRLFAGSNFNYGYYAFIDSNGQFVIGEERIREGGELYRGEYRGEHATPWLSQIKEENTKLYNNIVRYFREQKSDNESTIMCNSSMTDMENLNEIFNINKESIKKQFPQLYYAILAVLDKEKSCASKYFNINK